MIRITFPLRSVFLALPLEGESKRRFQALQEELKPWADVFSFQNSQTPHVTLMYWPEVSELEYSGIAEQVRKIADRHERFSLNANGVGTFGSRGRDSVMFLEVTFSDELARIKKSCPWTEGRPFHPHITIARICHPQRFVVEKKKILKVLGTPDFVIPFDALQLYGEVDGKKQTILQSFALTPNT